MEDARRIVADFVAYYNDCTLHGAIDYIAPRGKFEGQAEAILAEREAKLVAAREVQKAWREEDLTARS